jgi:hypothetical protein
MEMLVKVAELKETRGKLRYGVHAELSVAWTDARIIPENENGQSKEKRCTWNFEFMKTGSSHFNEGRITNEQLRWYIEGRKKRKAEDDEYVPLLVKEQQPTKKAKNVITKKKSKNPKKQEEVVQHMALEDEHGKKWQFGVPLEPLGIPKATVPLSREEKEWMQGWNWRDAVVKGR